MVMAGRCDALSRPLGSVSTLRQVPLRLWATGSSFRRMGSGCRQEIPLVLRTTTEERINWKQTTNSSVGLLLSGGCKPRPTRGNVGW